MSRSHGPDEFLDPRDNSAEAIRDPLGRVTVPSLLGNRAKGANRKRMVD